MSTSLATVLDKLNANTKSGEGDMNYIIKNNITVENKTPINCVEIVVKMEENLDKLTQLKEGTDTFNNDDDKMESIKYLTENIEDYLKILDEINNKRVSDPGTAATKPGPPTLKYADIKKEIDAVKNNDIEMFKPNTKTVTISFFNSFLSKLKNPPKNILGKIILTVTQGNALKNILNSITDVDELIATIQYGMNNGVVTPFYKKEFMIETEK